jgi:hypothetical protein
MSDAQTGWVIIMNIAQLLQSTTSASTAASQGATQTASAQAAVPGTMKKADARLQSQIELANTQLSAFGQLKSLMADLQTVTTGMNSVTATTSKADLKTAINRLVTSFNATLTQSRAGGTGGSAEAVSAGQVGTDLRKSLTGNSGMLDALRKLGVKAQTSGLLTFDTTKLDAAFQAGPASVLATISSVGKAIEKVVTAELAGGGNVSGSMAALSKKATALKAQQSALLSAVKNVSTNQATQSSAYVSYGLSKYTSSY